MIPLRTDRLLSLVALLRLRGRLTAAEIAAELEVSERTVLRDIDSLSVSGIPVYVERGRNGGFSLLPGFRADLSTLSIDESTALLAGGRLNPAEFASALRKIAVALPDRQREHAAEAARRILLRPEGFLGESTPMAVLGPLQQAVLEGRRVRVLYRRFDAEPKTRILDPIGLIAADSVWYLAANSDGEQRMFRVSRCRDVELLDEPAQRSDDVDLEVIWAESRRSFRERFELLRVVVDVDAAIVPALSLATKVLISEPATGGGARMTLTFADGRHASNVLWRFADGLVVVEPADLRAEIVARGRAVLAKMGSDETTC